MRMLKQQQGVAAIWFIFLIGAIMSFGALGIEGARYITKKARLGDGLEATSIAVSTADRIHENFNLSRVKPVAENWINHYVSDSNKVDLIITRKEDKKIYNINPLSPYEVAYYRYDVSATTKHKSWLNFSTWPSFDSNVLVANKAASGRVKGGHEPVDLVFVADFSGSMNESSCQDVSCRKRIKKIKALKNSIKEVTEAIYKANGESTFGFIPFSKRIVVKRNGSYYCSSPMLAPKNTYFKVVRDNQDFQKLLEMKPGDRNDWYQKKGWYSTFGLKEISERYISWIKNANQSNGTHRIDINNKATEGWTDLNYKNHISIARTASEITIEDQPIFPASIKYFADYKDGKPNTGSYCTTWHWVNRIKTPNYYALERTGFSSDFELKAFNDSLSEMSPGGGTDMYQGLLAAPHQFYGASNKNRYIMVLSDGEENSKNFEHLVKAGLCPNINAKLTNPGDGNKYNFKMFVVGIGFDPSNEPYNDCFGKENIIPVYNMDELKDKILGLITDDIGHNFDRYN